MNKRNQRRLGVEALEARLVLDSIGLGAGPPDADWQSVIVSFRDNVANPHAAAQALVNAHGGALGHVYEHALKGFSAQLPAQAVGALAKNPQVKLVEQDLVMEAFGQTTPTGVDRIDAEYGARPYLDPAKLSGGNGYNGVNIAIIDTGIDGSHPDLNVAGGYNATGLVTSAWNDGHGHGTHVAGIAAALDNGIGVVGVAPGARLWAVKVLSDRGTGKLSDIIEGIDWVTSTHASGSVIPPIDVANMSLGGTGVSSAYRTAIQNSVATGIVYVVAAGNNYRDILGTDLTFETADDAIPAAYPEVATISAIADSDGKPGGFGSVTSPGYKDDTFADFSNFSNSGAYNNSFYLQNNWVNSPGLGIDLMMPGVDIYSTYKGGGYATMSGTSMAAPHATGLAALYIAQHGPATSASEVYAIRQALIDAGKPWRSFDGLNVPVGVANPDSPDKHEENLGWAGATGVDLPPTVTITAPNPGATISGTVTITANANDDRGVAQVEFFADGVSIGVDKDRTDGWSIAWNTTGLSNHTTRTLAATATDTKPQTDTSVPITVTVDNTVATMTATLAHSSQTVNAKFWRANVTVTVTDAANQPLNGAAVTGKWSNGSTVSGVTGAAGSDGVVTFTSANLSTKSVSSITFTLTGVVLTGFECTQPTLPASIPITRPVTATSHSATLYDQLAAWQAIEEAAARPKDRILAPETVDFLMTLDE